MEKKSFEGITKEAKKYLVDNYESVNSAVANGYDIRPTEGELVEYMANFALHFSNEIKEEMQIKIDKQIEGTAESVSYAVANREEDWDSIIRTHESWPLVDVLKKLVESTEYLLHVKNYDKLGWEEISHCVGLAKTIILNINEFQKNQQ